jgi:hypothetical protein
MFLPDFWQLCCPEMIPSVPQHPQHGFMAKAGKYLHSTGAQQPVICPVLS